MSNVKNYAEALFSLSEELGKSESVLLDVSTARDSLSENPDYLKLADTPVVSVPEKLSLIDSAFSSLDESVVSLMKILCEKHSVHLFSDIAKEYVSLYNESRGIFSAEVISAEPLAETQQNKLKEKLEKITGKTIVIKNTVDKSVLGGIKLRYMGRELDGTLKGRLNAIENAFKNTIL
ncbi:MAG: ATP synthase F1 subunit delta [Clostridia bacterium]|nr:ATP synthase F1 subunit delta [Clostridia bacterium]